MLTEKDQKRQLLRENQELRWQLQKSKALIECLYNEIKDLKNQIAHYSQQHGSKTPQTPQTPKSPKMMVEQKFDYSSSEQPEKETQFQDQEQNQKSHRVKFKVLNLSQSTSQGRSTHLQLRKANTIILHSEEIMPRKSIQKILKKSNSRKKQLDNTIERQQSIRAISTRQIASPLPMFNRQFSVARSQKQILFKKTSNSKPIFQHFFVTGMTKDGPIITYNYPRDSGHDFSGYLALIYGENYLKLPDLSPCSSRNRINVNLMYRQNSQQPKKQCFVIPIMKSKGLTADRDYLIICENQQLVLQKVDKDNNSYYFSRFYCFLTQWKFFSEFRKLGFSLIQRMQSRKNHRQMINQVACGIQIGQQLQQSLSFLHQKTTDYNKTIDCCIGQSGLRFSADVPPLQLSYQLADKFLQNHLFNINVCVKVSEQEIIQTKLLGVLLCYTLAQIKILLYSSNKTKISECIVQLLQVIKPLVYVNPIIMSAIKQDHQNYLDAPMGLILGLWNENRRNNRQKIEIFMNKKLNLAGLIEKAKLNINDGIVINLDTGLIYGGGIDTQIISIAVKMNNIALTTKNSKNLRDYYKFVERLSSGRIDSEQGRSVWQSLSVYIRKTQLYCYYLQNKEDLS